MGAITISVTKALTPGTLHWKLRDLATGPPGKSPKGLGAKLQRFLWGLEEMFVHTSSNETKRRGAEGRGEVKLFFKKERER